MGTCFGLIKPPGGAAAVPDDGGARVIGPHSPSFKQLFTKSRRGNFMDNYDVLECLGKGMTGNVVLVRHKLTGSKFACKAVLKNHRKQSLVVELRKEISVLMTLDHPNVIKLYETWEDADAVYLVLEAALGGELYDNLISQKDGGHYTEARAGELFLMMVKAIAHCHERGIAHRDLKLENFVFATRADGDRGMTRGSALKLIDFGLSRKYGARNGPKT
jgi:calcium-dependent protein kinase